MDIIIKETLDGSHTLYNPDIGDHYHSTNGAIAESMHIFIRNGLLSLDYRHINIFEAGYGTGLNCLLTLMEAERTNQKIRYTSIEKYPLSPGLLSKMNYPDLIGGKAGQYYSMLTDAPWESDIDITDNFTLRKTLGDINDFTPDTEYDLVYYDAFGPDKQPEMWTRSLISKVSGMLREGGVFVTYSAKGELKRTLIASGFRVYHLPGPPGKREITRAVKADG